MLLICPAGISGLSPVHAHGICRPDQQLSLALWVVFAAVVLWTIAFDTYYAMVDRNDDLLVGIKSTAILFGKFDPGQDLLQVAMLGLLTWAGLLFGRGRYFLRACRSSVFY